MRGGIIPTAERINEIFGKIEPDGTRR